MTDELPAKSAEFRRVLPARDLTGVGEKPLSATADKAELSALAALLGVAEIASFSFDGAIAPAGASEWRLTGRARARLTQLCAVSLAPVAVEIDEPVDRRYAPEGAGAGADLDFDAEADDPPDAIGDGVDYGAAALEALTLAIDPYLRAPGAAFEARSATPPGAAPMTDDNIKPFAGLAALKKRMEGGN